MSQMNPRVAVPVVYIAAMVMSVLDTTIVTVSLPAIGRDLHAAPAALALVSVAYLVALAIFIPISGWVSDTFGARRTLLAAIGLFVIASLACGLAVDLPMLVVSRFVQGVGGAVMTPVGLGLLFRVFPPAERVGISAVVGIFTAIGPALGPILGGVFTTYATWRLSFVVNAPIGLAAIAVGLLALPRDRRADASRFDAAGLALSCVGLALLMYALCLGSDVGWASAGILVPLSVGIALVVALVAVELRVSRPLIDFRLFADRLFRQTTMLYGLASVTYLGVLFGVALFLQDELGMSAVGTGLTTFPSAIGVMVAGQAVSRFLYARLGPRRIVLAGSLVLAAAVGGLAWVTRGTDPWWIRTLMLGVGLGVGLVYIPAQAASMATIDAGRTARAAALYNAAKQFGGALGIALIGAVHASVAGTGGGGRATVGDLTGFHLAFAIAAAVALLGAVVALTVHDGDAAATRLPRPARTKGGVSPSARPSAGG